MRLLHNRVITLPDKVRYIELAPTHYAELALGFTQLGVGERLSMQVDGDELSEL